MNLKVLGIIIISSTSTIILLKKIGEKILDNIVFIDTIHFTTA